MLTGIIRGLNKILESLSLKQLAMLAVGAGILMCGLIFFTLTGIEKSVAEEKQVVAPVSMQRVVVARTSIKRGTIIESNMLRTKEFAVKSIPDGSATDIRAFVGLPAKVEIFSGDVLTLDKVFTDIRQAGFIGMIPENCRAITIPINNITGVAGLVNPGNYVDLVLVTQDQGRTKAEVLLQDIMLLGIDKVVDRDLGEVDARNKAEAEITDSEESVETPGRILSSRGELNDAISARNKTQRTAPTGVSGGTATLALKTDEVLKIIAAMQVGSIHLVLRPLNPTTDSMYIKDTSEYFGDAPPQLETPQITEQIQVQELPTEAKPQTSEESQENQEPSGFEIIRWGS